MSTVDRGLALKAGFLLALIEGWTTRGVVTDRFGPGALRALDWLEVEGYVATDDCMREVICWRGEVAFEALWGHLVPERPCPLRFRQDAPAVSPEGR